MRARRASKGLLTLTKNKGDGESIHSKGLEESTLITSFCTENFIPPPDIIRVLNKAKVRFVLLGIHGLVGWLAEPRASQSVELLVPARSYKKAIASLLKRFSSLVGDKPQGWLVDRTTQKALIVVRKPDQPLFREAFQDTHEVKAGKDIYRIPSLEMAIAMKAPVISMVGCDPDKHMDAHDFILMVKTNPDIDLNKLAKFGELICAHGGKIILEKVRQVRAGEKLVL